MRDIPQAIGPARFKRTSAGICITIPVRRSRFEAVEHLMIAVATFGALCWIDHLPEFWRFGMTFVLVVSFAKWMWRAMGRQLVTINKAALRIRNDLFGLGWQRDYFVNRILKLQYTRFVTSADVAQGPENCPSVGRLCFDYGNETIRLAGLFGEEDAARLIALMEDVAGAHLTELNLHLEQPSRHGIIAEELHQGAGGFLLFGWVGGIPYCLVMFSENEPLRVAAGILWAVMLAIGIVAEAGYRYRFTPAGLEIRTLGFRLKFIAVEQILHYEQARWTPADGRNIPLRPGQRSFCWGGSGVRISTLQGSVYLGHKWPERIVAELDRMKGLTSAASAARAAG